MLLEQITARLLVFAGMVLVVAATANLPEYCADCEEEIWEEVPCDRIPTTSTTSTTPPPINYTVPTPKTTSATNPTPQSTTSVTSSTAATPTKTPLTITTPTPIAYTRTATLPPLDLSLGTTTPPRTKFDNCYCECKVGCKEFCRKVVVSGDPTKQITQLTTTAKKVTGSDHVEVHHVHQRKYVSGTKPDRYSSPGGSPYNSLPRTKHKLFKPKYPMETGFVSMRPNQIQMAQYADGELKPPPPAYPSVQPERNYPDAMLNAPSYSIEDLTRILQSEFGGKGGYDIFTTEHELTAYGGAAAPLKAGAYSSTAKHVNKQLVHEPVYLAATASSDSSALLSAFQASAVASKSLVAAKSDVSSASSKCATENRVFKLTQSAPAPFRPQHQPNDDASVNGIHHFVFPFDRYPKDYDSKDSVHAPHHPFYSATY